MKDFRQLQVLCTILVLSFLLPACSLINPKRVDRNRPAPKVKDLPYKARSSSLAPLRKRVVVLPFLNEAARSSEQVSKLARKIFIDSLYSSDQFVLVTPNDIFEDTNKYAANNTYDLERMAMDARKKGISAIIEGKIISIKTRRLGDSIGLFRQVKAQTEALISIRVASARSGKILHEERKTATVQASTTRVAKYSHTDRFLEQDPNLVSAVVTKAFRNSSIPIVRAIEKISWEGRIANIQGERVFINAGRMTGIQLGDILRVTEEGREIYDPASGELIGKVPGRMKGTVEIISYFGKDGSIGLVHSGSGFSENDRVDLY